MTRDLREGTTMRTFFAALGTAATAMLGVAPHAAAQDQATITLWHHFTPDIEKAAIEEAAARFQAANPGVTIDITVVGSSDMASKTNAAMQANEPPDIFSGWGGGGLANYANAGLVQDITEAVEQDGWKERFVGGPLALYTLDGRVFGVPLRAGVWGMWIDKDLHAKAGIEGCPATWNDLLANVTKLKEAGIVPIALGGQAQWTSVGWYQYLALRMASWEHASGTARLKDRTGAFTDEPFVRAGDMIAELVAMEPFQPGYQGAPYDQQLSLAANGGAAMTFDGWWGGTWIPSAGTDVEATRARIGFCPFPEVEGGAGVPNTTMGSGNGFSVGRDAPPQAVDFLRFLTSDEEYTKLIEAKFAMPPVIVGTEALVSDPNSVAVIQLGATTPHFAHEWVQSLGPQFGTVLREQAAALTSGATNGAAAGLALEAAAQRAASQ